MPYTTLFRSVASNGDIYLKTRGQEGGVAALRDTTGDYRIDVVEYFSNMTPVRGGILWETGMEIHDGYLWVSNTESVYRWPMPENEELIPQRSEEHTSELQSRGHLVCRLLLEKKKQHTDWM